MNGVLQEEIYITIPEGFKAFYLESSPEIQRLVRGLGYKPDSEQVALVRKALYGLKQSPRE